VRQWASSTARPGSASGIGEAIARRYAAEGAGVVVNSIHSVQAGQAVAASLPDAVYVQADIADEQQGKGLVEAARARWGRNAGTTQAIPHDDLEAADAEVWRRIFDVNVLGTWLVTRSAVPLMRENGGAIVNITSLAGQRPVGSSIPYAASKAALNHLTRLLANVLGPAIRVNAVAPGLVDTPWTADCDAIRDLVKTRAPLQRSGQPDDIAEVALTVAVSTYMTGEVIVVDGGLHLR
jgi:ketoreductase RED2